MRPLGIVLRGRFLFVTTCETKNGLLLIEVFSKLFNPQNDEHQGSILGSHFILFLLLTYLTKSVRYQSQNIAIHVLPPKAKPIEPIAPQSPP